MTQLSAASAGEHCPLAILQMLHRCSDGFVSFHLKRGSALPGICSIRADELDVHLPRIADRLDRDAYFTIHSFRETGWQPVKGLDLPPAFRKGRGVRYLTACFADLDCYKIGLTADEALEKVRRVETDGKIPRLSFTANSGRGLWLYWLLADEEDPAKPVRAWPEKIDIYYRIQLEISRCFAALGADPHAKDVARVTRFPLSIHSGTETQVEFDIPPEHPSYTLHELADCFGAYQPQPTRRTQKRNANNRAGYVAMQSRRLEQFHRLEAIRGGYEEGCRNHAALILAVTLRAMRIPLPEVEDAIFTFGADRRPPLSRPECAYAVRSTDRPGWKIRNQTIADWLSVTPEESAQLLGWPAAAQFGLIEKPEKLNRDDRRRARRAAILGMTRPGLVVSVRDMARRLRDLGHAASVGTVQRDYVALGIRGTVTTSSLPLAA